jgi:hypothetical protein
MFGGVPVLDAQGNPVTVTVGTLDVTVKSSAIFVEDVAEVGFESF